MRIRLGLASLLLLVGSASTAHAQPAPDPAPAPGAPPDPFAPAPGAPAPAPGAPAPAPADPFAPAPAPAPPPGDGGFSFSGGFDTAGEAGAAAETPAPESDEKEWRRRSLTLQNNLAGSTGLLRISNANSGAVGTFRVEFLGSYYSGSGFLCTGQCPPLPGDTPGADDEVSRVGAHLTINATLFPFLETYLGLHSYATSNDQGRPELLQVLGDTNLGAKVFMPHQDDQIFGFGGELGLWLLNGTGGVGVDGGGTSFGIRGLATLDLDNRTQPEDRLPLRAHVNIGYLFDNSGKLVEDTERRRGNVPITRIERFGLDINRVDQLQAGVGVEGVFDMVQPFVEWTIDIPVNRQGYTCNRNTVFAGDGCLGDDAGFSTSPSRLGLGARVTPWFEGTDWLTGLSATLAAEVGTGATSDFIEEVAPELPWNLYFGLGYAYDTQRPDAEPVIQTVEVEKVREIPPPPVAYIAGSVVETGTETGIPDAIVRYESGAHTAMVTSADGRFETKDLEPGTYTFLVSADGYRDGTCTATIPPLGTAFGAPGQPQPGQPQPGFGAPPADPGFGAPPAPAPPGQPQPGFGPQSRTDLRSPFLGQPGVPQPGQPDPGFGGQPGFGQPAPGQPQPGFGQAPPAGGQPGFGQQPGFGAQPPPTLQPAPPTIIQLRCELEALPKVGNVVGALLDAEDGSPVGGAKVTIADKLNRQLELTADGAGAFRFENVPPGMVTITVEKEGYLKSVTDLEVEAREDISARIRLNKRPKQGKVVVTARELQLREKVHFAHDSADISPDSMALIQEIADVMERQPDIQEVEIQGHTDNTGSAPYNLRLSQERADAVKDALVKLGIASSRLSAKGYGQEKPLLPNTTDANRARNRRVQLIITKKGR